MAQNPLDGEPGGGGLTSSTVNFSALGSVDHRVPELASVITGAYLRYFAQPPAGKGKRGGVRNKALSPTERLIGSTKYEYHVIHEGEVIVNSVTALGFRLVIRNAVTRALLHEIMFHYSVQETFNLSSQVGAVLYP